MASLKEEISRRRTFAIISHPDAGKTTLTEKFLLYGGAIAQAGAVKGKKNSRAAVSDWMEIEKQRGISVTSSVMQFQYEGFCINILDTPGHQDFSEDTYRTLMAADSAVMVIDGAKGVEPQTRKLFKVCAMRHIPIFTFINKMDREARDPFELLDELENELGIETYACNWPMGSGREFQGVYDRRSSQLIFFSGVSGKNRADKMEIEKQRGISVTSSVMQFQYNGFCINILDTPGHQDFSEDTYRTLMAADSAVMVIDGAKGVEPQTRKLFKVCAMRHIPIFTFVNKMDREAKDPFDLLDEVERELGIETYAMNWPIGSGKDFQGVYDREKAELLFFSGISGKKRADKLEIDLYDPQVAQLLDSEEKHRQLIDDVELLSAGREMDMQAVRDGQLSPVFFGSALTNFGIEPFLEAFLKLTPPPLARTADCGVIDPFSPDFSAFVFKIQANMNKAHRDRLAFMRICSGKFQRDAEYFHVQGNKKMRLSQPQQLMAAEREIVDEAYAGDVIGVFDPGIFSIGDTITVPGKKFRYSGIPTFAPEHFCRVSAKDSMKRKQFVKGTEQIAQEGAIQIFKVPGSGFEEVIVGVVGTLQFDVFQYRMKNEYGVELRMEMLPYEEIRLIDEYPGDLTDLNLGSDAELLEDYRGRSLLVFSSFWAIDFTCRRNPGLKVSEIVVAEG